jgi:hypothetical protein
MALGGTQGGARRTPLWAIAVAALLGIVGVTRSEGIRRTPVQRRTEKKAQPLHLVWRRHSCAPHAGFCVNSNETKSLLIAAGDRKGASETHHF